MTDAAATRLGLKIERDILDALQRHPDGLTIDELRSVLGNPVNQEHLGRRVRKLRERFHLPLIRLGNRQVYVLKGPRSDSVGSETAVSQKLRAEILHLARGRCQMCGRTVSEDGIKLHVDHKIPVAWGGVTVAENLWALCAGCNQGKKNHFASFDDGDMKAILLIESVHERIAQFLKRHLGTPVSSLDLEFVANATERQEDWQKRLRELRYPVVGLVIETSRKKVQGFHRSFYTLRNWKDLPAGHQKLIREWEKPANRKRLCLELGIG